MKRPCQLAVFFLVLFTNVLALRAEDVTTSFEQANKAYEEGKFAEAAGIYDKLITTGNISEPLYFNRGNAYFKLGQTGRAIASYREAQQLAPRDPDLRANLQLARTRARGGSTYHVDRWRSWLTELTTNEWAVATATAVWLLFILLALGQWCPGLSQKLRGYIITTGVTAVGLGICSAMALKYNFSNSYVVVIVGEADVRNGPLEEAPSMYKVRDGAELDVVDEKEGWLQVVDPADRAGWLRREQVLSPANPIPPKSKS